MQVQAPNISEHLRTSAFQNVKVSGKEVAAETEKVEKVEKETQGHSGVKRTSTEKCIYQGESPVQEASAKRIAEIKEKLGQLVNQASGMEILGIKQEGYSLNASDVEKIETVMDQIQIKLATYCESYEPIFPVDSEMAEEVLGNAVLAGNVTQKFEEYGVPATEDNLKSAGEAIEMAQSVETPTRNEAGYMAANGIEPTIENLYKTEHTPVPEKGAELLPEETWNQLKKQAEQILSEAGLEATEDNLDTARWMVEQGIPLDKDMLRAFSNILSVDGEMSTDEIVDTIAQAMAKGKEARAALMTGEGYSKERVEEVFASVKEAAAQEEISSNKEEMQFSGIDELTKHRRLEEIRLVMTTQAGMALLKQGIDIDTFSLSELVDALKEQEKEYYKALYECDGLEASAEKLEQLSEVSQTIEALKDFPSYIVGNISNSGQEITIDATYQAGVPMKAALDAAHMAYEPLMTAPDREYGDSLSKAFANIDDLLAEMDRETTPENRRVIKILAYNQMELNDQNMEAVTELDKEYQYLLKNLTPRVTMHMIENHINPLKTELHKLNDQIEEIKKEIGPEPDETYSEFLWKLEKKTELPKEERDAYIGLYRLLNQVDRAGEAAIGALVNQEREVTLENLLGAVRTRKAKGMDVAINDEFGFLTELIPKGVSISDQLKGFMDTMGENNGAYEEEQKKRIAEFAKEDNTLRVLAQSEEVVSLDNMEAAHQLAYEELAFLQKVQTMGKKQEKGWVDRFESKEAMAEGYKELEKESQTLLSEAMQNTENGRAVIEEMRMLCHTVTLTGKLASFEDYHMPVDINGETCAVHVRLVHKEGEAGKAEVSMEFPGEGSVRADFRLGGDNLSAFIVSDSRALLEELKGAGTEFSETMLGIGIQKTEISYAGSKEIPPVSDTKEANTADTGKLYQITKEFITAVVKSRQGNADKNIE